ncbi:MAG: twin-arginine translocase TatA/TatE family subunit [Actinobacteria bacterium]|jgi:Sec-independent protein translocase protein TatA|nr:twin-arginine translocase TatA/TatE family subunit [Actinomycetota bacterium]
MLDVTPAKLLIVLVFGLIILGPDKLPRVAKQAGEAWNSFKQFRMRMESEMRDVFPQLPSTTEIANAVRSPISLLDRLAASSDPDIVGSDSDSDSAGGDERGGEIDGGAYAADEAIAGDSEAAAVTGGAVTGGTGGSGKEDGWVDGSAGVIDSANAMAVSGQASGQELMDDLNAKETVPVATVAGPYSDTPLMPVDDPSFN